MKEKEKNVVNTTSLELNIVEQHNYTEKTKIIKMQDANKTVLFRYKRG